MLRAQKKPGGDTVYVFLADGFEEIEALAPVDILRRAGVKVQTVGVTGQIVTGSHGVPVTADIAPADVAADAMRAVVLPGGMPGTKNLEASPAVQAALDAAAARENVVIAAICAAPSVLGRRGLLEGRRATCFPGFESALRGAEVTGEPVTVAGRFVTGRGAGAAVAFGLRLVSELCSPEKAAQIGETMQCR